MTPRKASVIALIILFSVLLASCAPTASPAGSTDKATSGEITVYTALEDDQLAKYLPLFSQKHPNIKVNIVRDSTGIVTAKLLAEKANPRADVVWGLAATSLLVADKQGMLEPYAPEGVDKIRASFKDSKNPPHWVGIDTWFSAFCVNTKELAAKKLPMPATWDDLLKPEYKGLIVMPNPNSSGTGYLSISAILQLKGEAEGWKYLDKLNDNMAVYTHSGSKPCKMAGAGETVIGISFDYRAVQQKADGQPIEAVFPKEGSGWETEANALVKKASIKPAARTFLDWAISSDAMKAYAKSYPITAMDTGVAIPAGYPADPLKQLIKNDLVKAAGERERVLQEWMKRYDAKSEPLAAAPAPTAAPASAKVVVNNPPKTAAEVDAIELKGKNVSVTYWHNRPQKDQDFLQSMLDEFNKSNPYGITAKAEIAGASYNDVYNKINAAIQANQPPDISVAYQNQAAFYRNQGAIIDLTPFVQSKTYGLNEADLKDYFQTFLNSDKNPQFKGEVLGFPTQRSMEVMFYNADWLKQLGYNEPPKDWKTFEEIVCKAVNKDKKQYGWAFRHDASNFASQVFSRGGRILAEDGMSYVFNSQAGIDTVKMIQTLFEKGCAVEIPTSERYGEQNRFGNGEVLFVFASSSGLPFYKETVDKGAKFKWDIAMLPNTGKPAVNLYGASVSVYKTTPEKELAAWLVIKFLGDKAQTSRWAIQTGYLPVRQSAVADVVAAYKANPAWAGGLDASYARMFDWVQYAMIESPVAGYDPVRALIDTDIMSKVLTDPKVDAKKLLDDGVTKANTVLKENAPK